MVVPGCPQPAASLKDAWCCQRRVEDNMPHLKLMRSTHEKFVSRILSL
jgi:hypothetical protein